MYISNQRIHCNDVNSHREPPYSVVYMKEKLEEHFGKKIEILTVNNRNVVTFRSAVASIISEFYKQPKVDDNEVEKIRIVETAAKPITSAIKNLQSRTKRLGQRASSPLPPLTMLIIG